MDLSLSRAVEGFMLYLQGVGRSPHTLRDYNTTLSRFVQWRGPTAPMSEITTQDVVAFLAYWRGAEVTPRGGVRRPARMLSNKTLKNMHTALSSFWTWATDQGYAPEHIIIGKVAPPRDSPPVIEPLTRPDIDAILAACDTSRPGKTRLGRTMVYSRPTARRDRAIVLLLLDTGLRASELCSLLVDDVDLSHKSAQVRRGKGDKPRLVAFSDFTGSAIFRYWAERSDNTLEADDRAFVTSTGRRMTASNLLTLIRRLGERAGVVHCHPHRFRHTFAITWLRNNGDIFTLQEMLGHNSLDMVRRYLKIAGSDIMHAHRRASPVANWYSK